MKKVAAAAVVAIGIAGCGHASLTAAQDKALERDGRVLLRQCIGVTSVKKLRSCAVPSGSGPKFQRCAVTAVEHGVLTKKERQATEVALGQCAVSSR